MTTTTANNARKPWPPEHDEYLRTHINKHSYLTLGLALGRSALSVKQRCHLIGIKRTVDLRKAATVNPHHAGARPNQPKRAAPPPPNNRAAVFNPSNPEHLAARRARERTLTAAGPVVNSNMLSTYNGAELAPYAGRPGAMDAFALPSRRFDKRVYRDGRVEGVA